MKKTILVLLVMLQGIAFGQNTNVERAEQPYFNFLTTNPGFENGLTGWTNSGATFALNAAGLAYAGQRSASWTAAVNNTLTSPVATITNSSSAAPGVMCVASLWYLNNVQRAVSWEVRTQAGTQIRRGLLPGGGVSTAWSRAELAWPCAQFAKTVQIRLTALSGTTGIYVDQFFIGTAPVAREVDQQVDGNDFENGMPGWELYADAAATSPVDGTGGSSSLDVTGTQANAIQGGTSIVVTKDAVNRQGQGVSWKPLRGSTSDPDDLDPSLLNRRLNVQFSYLTSGYTSGDIIVYAIDGTTVRNLGSLSSSATPAKFTGTFQFTSNASTFRLALHVATTSATGYSVTIDDVTIKDATLPTPLVDDYADFNEESVPATPASNTSRLYVKSDGLFYSKDDAGVESRVTATTATPTATGVTTSYYPVIASSVSSSAASTVTLTTTDGIKTLELTGTTQTVNLPACASNTGRDLDIKKTSATGTATIDPNAAETIDGASTLALATQYDHARLTCDGTNWHRLVGQAATAALSGYVVPGTQNFGTGTKTMGGVVVDNTTIDNDAISSTGGISLLAASGQVVLNASNQISLSGTVALLNNNMGLAFYDAGSIGAVTLIGPTPAVGGTVYTLPNGPSGTLLATSTTQTVTNKDIDGGTASNTSRLTVPQATKTTLDGLTRKEATLAYANDSDKLYVDNGTTLTEVGSGGSGEINMIKSPSDVVNWSETGTVFNGSPTTTSTAGDLPLAGTTDTAIKMTASGSATESGTYVSYTFTPGNALLSRKHKVEFWMRPGTGFATGEWTVSVYTTGGTRMPLSTDASAATLLPNFTGKFTTSFDADTTASYTLRFARTSGAGSAVLNVANVVVGPGIQPQGAVVGDWVSTTFTPTITTNATTVASERRIGDTAQYQIKTTFTGANTQGGVSFTLPTGRTIDTTKLRFNGATAGATPLRGHVLFRIGGVNYLGYIVYDSTTAVSAYSIADNNTATSFLRSSNQFNTSTPVPTGITIANADFIQVEFEVPISEWSGSGTLNVAQNDVEYVYNSTTADTSDTTSFAYGPVGGLVPGALTAGRAKRVRFITPIQTTDLIVPEYQPVGGTSPWLPIISIDNAADVGVYTVQNGASYGIGLRRVAGSTTDLDVSFGQYAWSSSTYGAAGVSWATPNAGGARWRIRKVAGGNAVGFGLASTTSAGLVSTTTQTFNGDKTITNTAAVSLKLNSGGATNASFYELDRAGTRVFTLGAAGATNDFLTGSAQGDSIVRYEGGSLLFGASTINATLSSTGLLTLNGTGLLYGNAATTGTNFTSNSRTVASYEEATFATAFANFGATTPTVTFKLVKHGNAVTLRIAAGVGTTKTQTTNPTSGDNLPANFRPVTNPVFIPWLVRDNGTYEAGWLTIDTAGSIVFRRGNLNAWTASGSAELSNSSGSYTLN